MKIKKIILVVLSLLLISMVFTGCMRKPYKKPVLVEASPNETLIIDSLEGNDKELQSQLKSLEYYKNKQVASKRYEIAQKWLTTGRPYFGMFAKGNRSDQKPKASGVHSNPD